ncbi:hypothetical protein ACNFJN_12560 [Xenorhabdus budapestensis]|uniref:hypothetical protein n=1 Tax=Xenorhabdus budapestensis TaxID=290110 RepID=UPI003A872008
MLSFGLPEFGQTLLLRIGERGFLLCYFTYPIKFSRLLTSPEIELKLVNLCEHKKVYIQWISSCVVAAKERQIRRERIRPAKGWPPVRGRSLSLIPGSIDNRMFIKTVTGVSERSQQRGDLKDEEYIHMNKLVSTKCGDKMKKATPERSL